MVRMLEDKVAIITGSGRGIGRAAALMFADQGARVVVSDIDAEPAEDAVTEIKARGSDALAYVGDVTAPEFARGIVEKATETWGALHIIVNNAGFNWDSQVHKMTEEQWDKIMDVHLKAPFRIIQAAKPFFCQCRGKNSRFSISRLTAATSTRGTASWRSPGSGSASRSTLPLGIRGKPSNTTKAGIMCLGR